MRLPLGNTAEGDVEGSSPPRYPQRRLLKPPGGGAPVGAAEGNAYRSLPPAVWINQPEKMTHQDGSGLTIVDRDDPEVVPVCRTYGQFEKLGVMPRELATAPEAAH